MAYQELLPRFPQSDVGHAVLIAKLEVKLSKLIKGATVDALPLLQRLYYEGPLIEGWFSLSGHVQSLGKLWMLTFVQLLSSYRYRERGRQLDRVISLQRYRPINFFR